MEVRQFMLLLLLASEGQLALRFIRSANAEGVLSSIYSEGELRREVAKT